MQNHTHPPTQKSKPGEKKKNEKKNTHTPPQPLTFLPSSFCSRSVRPCCRPAQYVILSYPSRSVPLATLFLSIPVPISLSRISFSPVVVALFRSLARPRALSLPPPQRIHPHPIFYLTTFFTLITFSYLLHYHLCFYPSSLPRSVIFYITTLFYHFLSPFTLPPSLPLSIIFYLATCFITFHHLLPCHLLYNIPSSFTFLFFSLYPHPFSIFTDPPAASSSSSVRPHTYFVIFYLSGFFFII